MRINNTGLVLLGTLTLGLAIGRTASADVTLLNDNFNSENGGNYQLNYNNFANWNVLTPKGASNTGTVDLIGNGSPWDFFPGSGDGLYIDLDGSTNQSGILQSKTNFALGPGTYQLSFELAGSQRGENGLTDVRLGNVYNQVFFSPASQPFETYTETIDVTSATSGYLSFYNFKPGNTNIGPLLDDVSLVQITSNVSPTSTPEPGSAALLIGMGTTGIGLLARRRRVARK